LGKIMSQSLQKNVTKPSCSAVLHGCLCILLRLRLPFSPAPPSLLPLSGLTIDSKLHIDRWTRPGLRAGHSLGQREREGMGRPIFCGTMSRSLLRFELSSQVEREGGREGGTDGLRERGGYTQIGDPAPWYWIEKRKHSLCYNTSELPTREVTTDVEVRREQRSSMQSSIRVLKQLQEGCLVEHTGRYSSSPLWAAHAIMIQSMPGSAARTPRSSRSWKACTTPIAKTSSMSSQA